DAGVHALSNVCHLPPHEPSVVKKVVNHFLQTNEGDIMISDVRCVVADFHARYKGSFDIVVCPLGQHNSSMDYISFNAFINLLLGLLFYFYRLLSSPESLSIIEMDRAWQRNLIFQQCRKLARFLRDVMISNSLKAFGCQDGEALGGREDAEGLERVEGGMSEDVVLSKGENREGLFLRVEDSEGGGSLQSFTKRKRELFKEAAHRGKVEDGMRNRARYFGDVVIGVVGIVKSKEVESGSLIRKRRRVGAVWKGREGIRIEEEGGRVLFFSRWGKRKSL
ncbi:tRNA pseudouridine synthase A isoform X1, partial [Tanacetum coccineum]